MELDDLDLRKLRAFWLVARYGRLRAAASRLKITSSAVSFSIRQLEGQLGTALFERTPNRLILTQAGERFARTAEAIFDEIGNILAASPLDTAPRGRLLVSVNDDLAWYFVPKISAFLRMYPEVELGVYINNSSDTLRLVAEGEVNVGIGRFLKVPDPLSMQPVFETSVSLVCSLDHPLARRKAIRLADLARYKLITLLGRHSTRQKMETAFAEVGIETRSYIEAGNCQTICEFAEAGIGVGVVHTSCIREAATRLHHRELSRYFGKATFSMVCPKYGAGSPIFVEVLREALSSGPASPRKR